MKRENSTKSMQKDQVSLTREGRQRSFNNSKTTDDETTGLSLSSHERLDRALSLLTSRPKLAKQHSSRSTVSISEWSFMSSASDCGFEFQGEDDENENDHSSSSSGSSAEEGVDHATSPTAPARPSFFRSLSGRSINKSSQHRQEDSNKSPQETFSLAFLSPKEFASLPRGIHEFYLKKRSQSSHHLHGIRWVEDPTGKTWLHHTRHWPRDWASIRGKSIKVQGRRWLLATQVRQSDETKWHSAPKGAAIPFHAGEMYCLVEKKLAGTSRDHAVRKLTKSLSSRSCGKGTILDAEGDKSVTRASSTTSSSLRDRMKLMKLSESERNLKNNNN